MSRVFPPDTKSTTAWNGNDNETVRHAVVLTGIMLNQLTR